MTWKRALLPTFGLAFLFSLVQPMFGQSSDTDNSTPSLGEIARKNKKSTSAKAKSVITDDNMKAQSGPIPGIALDGVDNSSEIIEAIHAFKKGHAPEGLEEAIRLWYDDSDSIFQKALEDNERLRIRKEDRALSQATGEYASQMDYRAAMEHRNSEIRQDRNDFRSYQRNGFLIARVQQSMMKVRTDLQIMGLRYEWFKIRNGNGSGSF